MKKERMELIDKGFTQKIADKYTNLQLFTTNFAPIISTKRIIPRMRWLEFVYALPYLVLRREILNSFKRTKNVFASVKQIWNIFLQLDYPRSRYEYITTRSHRFSREIVKMQDARYKIQVKPVSSSYVNHVKSHGFYFAYPYSQLKPSSMELALSVSPETTGLETEKEPAVKNYQLPVVTHQPPVVSHKSSAVSNKNQDISSLSGTSDFIAPIFRSYSFKPTSFLSQKTVPNVHLQKGDTVLPPYGHLERVVLPNGQKIFSSFESSSMTLAHPVSHETTRKETESAFINYLLPIVTQQPPVVTYVPSAVSNKNLVTYIPSGTSDFIAPIFRSYSFKPTSFLSQKTVPNEHLQKGDTVLPPYGHLERVVLPNGQKIFSSFESSSMELAQPVSHETTRKETESAFINYPLPVVTYQPPVVSHKPSAVRYEDLATYILTSTSDFITPLFSYFNLKTSSMELFQPVSHETSTTNKIETEKESAFTNYQLPVVTHQPPVVSHKSPAVRYEDLATYILTSTSDFITPLFSYYSFKPASFLSQKTVPVKQRGAALILQKSDATYPPYGHLERETLESGQKIISYFNFKSSSMELTQPVSHETSTSIKPTQPLNQKISAGEVEIEKNIYHTYPEIEHVESTHTEIIKERVIEKEAESKPPQVTPQLPSIDANRLADQVYSFIERKIRIEKERRGL